MEARSQICRWQDLAFRVTLPESALATRTLPFAGCHDRAPLSHVTTRQTTPTTRAEAVQIGIGVRVSSRVVRPCAPALALARPIVAGLVRSLRRPVVSTLSPDGAVAPCPEVLTRPECPDQRAIAVNQTVLMASFADIENVEPDLADRVRAILSSTTNAVLGTIRRDGSPRLSGADPYFHDGQLRIWSMPRARKGQDLRRDPRVAVHSIPWDSRKLRDGVADVGQADAKVTGTAVLFSDNGERSAFRAWLKSERGFEPPEDWDLFTVDIDALTVISVDHGQLVVDRWSTTDGRQTMRRA